MLECGLQYAACIEGRVTEATIHLYFNDICLIGGFRLLRLLRLLSLEQFLNMLLASLLTLFTLNKRYQSFDRFFYLSVSRFPFGRKVQDSPVDLSQPCELL